MAKLKILIELLGENSQRLTNALHGISKRSTKADGVL